mmetsp:Transcript_29960/g.61642  ORF Transcript_29960/g.61642 Transcript_29960/m.61642 type:complete len:205 (-) Transcript_29960:880-1494(-)
MPPRRTTRKLRSWRPSWPKRQAPQPPRHPPKAVSRRQPPLRRADLDLEERVKERRERLEADEEKLRKLKSSAKRDSAASCRAAPRTALHAPFPPICHVCRSPATPCTLPRWMLDPHDGGHVKTPDGKRVNLRFQDDLWYLPVFASPTHVARKPPTVVSRTACTDNPFALLTDVTDEPPSYPVPAYVSQWTHEDIEQAHQSWCHP